MGSQRRTRAQWRKLVSGWPGSGLTQQRYCHRHGVSVASLQRWRAIFRDENTGVEQPASEPLRLLPVTLADSPTNQMSAICLVFADGLRIELGMDFRPAVLRQVLDVVRPSP